MSKPTLIEFSLIGVSLTLKSTLSIGTGHVNYCFIFVSLWTKKII